MTRTTFGALSLSLCAALLSACEPSAGTEDFDPSLAPDRTIASLGDAEVATYCEELRAYVGRHVSTEEMQDLICRVFAISLSPDAAACEASRVGCAETPPEVSIGCIEDADRSSCDASVEELAACESDRTAAMSAVGEMLTCDLAGDPAALQELDASLQPESCRTLFARCPTLQPSMTAM